ncbi:MAG TPA: ATP-binding protein [Mycobacteriales bacterium]|jgi:heavy metal sensor kinase
MRVRVRLTLWYVLLLAATIAAMSVFLVVRQRDALIAGVDGALASRARQVVAGLPGEGGGAGAFADAGDAVLAGLAPDRAAAQVLSARGEVLDSAGDPVAESAMLPGAALRTVLGGQTRRSTQRIGGERFRVLAVPLPTPTGRQALVLTASLSHVERSVRSLAVLILLTAPAVLLAAAGGGWWLAGHALRPVVRMTEAAERIGVDDPGRRVGVPGPADELRRLAETLNAMLDRVHRGVEDKRRFVADASHELRTPLAVMRTELDVEVRRAELPAEARDVLRSCLEEVERMTTMVENLLTLTRLDEGHLALLPRRFGLGDAAAHVAEQLRTMADAKGVRLTVAGADAPVTADRDRIEQALANLVDNAIRYVGPGGRVDVTSWRDGARAGVTVADTGPGIAPDVLPHVFDRFFRADEARARADGGTGLGLAICREIVEAHQGRVEVTSTPGRGSAFSVTLPSPPTLIPISSSAAQHGGAGPSGPAPDTRR